MQFVLQFCRSVTRNQESTVLQFLVVYIPERRLVCQKDKIMADSKPINFRSRLIMNSCNLISKVYEASDAG